MKGYKRPLTEKDIWKLQDTLSSKHIGNQFDVNWMQELRNKKVLLVLVNYYIFKNF